jgi:hypothetical protein
MNHLGTKARGSGWGRPVLSGAERGARRSIGGRHANVAELRIDPI